MNLLAIGISAGVVVLLVALMHVLWRRYYGVDHESLLGSEQLDAIRKRLERLGFADLHIRPLFRSRSVWAAMEREALRVEMEMCDGGWRDYTRVTCTFKRPLQQGVQMMCEEGAGLMGWLYSLHEVQSEDEEINDRFIMLTRDDERLHELLTSPLRQHIIRLRDRVEDFKLTDQALFVYQDALVQEDDLTKIVEEVIYLASDLIRWSQDKGPIATLHTGQYQDALAEMDMYATRASGTLAAQDESSGVDEGESTEEDAPNQSEFEQVDRVVEEQ